MRDWREMTIDSENIPLRSIRSQKIVIVGIDVTERGLNVDIITLRILQIRYGSIAPLIQKPFVMGIELHEEA
jgi:hypothetical protein